jgi:hypothetical protein
MQAPLFPDGADHGGVVLADRSPRIGQRAFADPGVTQPVADTFVRAAYRVTSSWPPSRIGIKARSLALGSFRDGSTRSVLYAFSFAGAESVSCFGSNASPPEQKTQHLQLKAG